MGFCVVGFCVLLEMVLDPLVFKFLFQLVDVIGKSADENLQIFLAQFPYDVGGPNIINGDFAAEHLL
jgi:hypothetical protein